MERPELDLEDISLPLKGHERDTLLLAIYDRLARIEARVDAIPDHEDRIRSLEKRFWGIPGSLLVALMALFGFPH